MTVSVLSSLTMLPSGEQGQPFTVEELGAYLRDPKGADLLSDAEKARNARHARRDRLYQDDGHQDIGAVLDAMFVPRIAEKLKRRVDLANFSNALKRIVGELSTVYAKPARRYVANAADQVKLDAVVEALDLDAQMAVVNAMLNLHRALIVAPRVRVNADRSRDLVLDIATPSTVRALANPLDTTQILAWLIRVDMPLARNPYPRRPEWVLWSDHEWVYLDEKMVPIAQSWTEHGLGLNRWVPLSYSANAIPRFWPGKEGEDLVAADLTMWLCAILMIKETQATTKQPIATGDMSNATRGQIADSTEPTVLPEGVVVTTLDIGTDPEVFIKAGDHALERTGNNYGLSMGALTHQGTQSAEARDLMLAPVRERRGKQVHIMRRFEARLIRVIARVLAVDLPAMAFNPDGFRINFGETQTILSKADRLDAFETERRLGVTDTIEFLMAEDPDLDEESAWALLEQHVRVEVRRNMMMRPLQAISGSLGADAPGTPPQTGTPQGPVADRGAPPATDRPMTASADDLSWVEEVVNAAA